jgi:CRP-like cAMP-binding protein
MPHVEDMPAPSALVASFEDSGIAYWVRYYTRDFQRCEVTDAEVRARIWYALDRRGISIPFPIRTLRMDTASPRAEMGHALHGRAATLADVELFRVLPDEAREHLAAASGERRYAPGELVIRQGDDGDELFVLERGDVSVLFAATPDDEPTVLAHLTEGDFFGEMSLMTGERRTATVRADTECTLVVVDKDAFAPVLDRYPELAEEISRLLVARQDGLANHMGSLPPSRRKQVDHRSGQLLGKIRSFFSL